jgi:hypothetical protein
MTSKNQPAKWPGDSRWSKLMDSNVHGTDVISSGYRYGSRCRLVCEQLPVEYLRNIARMILGRHISQAYRIYPNIRVVIRDGQELPVTMDYVVNRINVETYRNIIIRIIGFY